MVINRNSIAKALYPGVMEWWGAEYMDWAPEYTDLYDTFSSKRAYEEMMQHVLFGVAVEKPEGDNLSYDTASQGFLTRAQHITYGLGFIITMEAMEDNLYMELAEQRTRALARSIRLTKEIVGANVYNRAFNSTYKGGDGKEMCATDHPNWSGGTFANELSTAADLSEAALEQACIDIEGFTDDRGLKIAVKPQTLIIPRQLAFDAERLLVSPLRVGTGDNDINALRTMSKLPGGYKVNHYLTDTDAWFLRTTQKNSLKYLERMADVFDQDNEFDTKNLKYAALGRYSFVWVDPRGIFGSPGA